MTASYPTSVKSFTTKLDNISDVMAADVNDLQNEVSAVETTLVSGTFPNGATFPNDVTAGHNLLVTGDAYISGDARFGVGIIVSGSAQFGGEVYTEPYTSFSGSSVVTGWSSLSTKRIDYMRIGKLVLLTFNINGTSNATSASFTLPYNSNVNFGTPCKCINSGTVATGYLALTEGSNVCTFYPTYVFGSNWINAGAKQVTGQLWYLSE